MKILVTWHWRTVTRMVKPVISALLIHLSVYYLWLHVTVEKVAQTSSVYCKRAGQNVDMTKYHKMLSFG